MFTVVIPLYNKEKSIVGSVQSVLNQSYPDFELLIVNDGSTDKSLSVVSGINDQRIKVINKSNGGVSSARNMGIQQASRPYIAFLDGDDQWASDFLTTIKGLIENFPKASVYATGWAFKQGESIISKKIDIEREGIIDSYFKLSLNGTILSSSSTCIKKSVFDEIAPFNENLTHGEDLDLWERLAQKFAIAIHPEIKAYYMRDAENRALNRVPPTYKSIVDYINPGTIKDKYQREYYRRYIYNNVYAFARGRQLKRARGLAIKYKGFVKAHHYLYYFFIMTFNSYLINKRELKKEQ